MLVINGLRDLGQFGIDVLTGEADATIQRHLCDLTWNGVRVWCRTFGMIVPENEKELRGMFFGNCNSGSKDDPHVAQVMIPTWHSNIWQTLAVFALCEDGAIEVVVTKDGMVYGFYPRHKEQLEDFNQHATKLESFKVDYRVKGYRTVHNDNQQGDRNVHQFSGTVHAEQEKRELKCPHNNVVGVEGKGNVCQDCGKQLSGD